MFNGKAVTVLACYVLLSLSLFPGSTKKKCTGRVAVQSLFPLLFRVNVRMFHIAHWLLDFNAIALGPSVEYQENEQANELDFFLPFYCFTKDNILKLNYEFITNN